MTTTPPSSQSLPHNKQNNRPAGSPSWPRATPRRTTSSPRAASTPRYLFVPGIFAGPVHSHQQQLNPQPPNARPSQTNHHPTQPTKHTGVGHVGDHGRGRGHGRLQHHPHGARRRRHRAPPPRYGRACVKGWTGCPDACIGVWGYGCETIGRLVVVHEAPKIT